MSNLRYVEQPSRQYLQDLYNSVVLKDIVKRNNIRDVDLLKRIVAYIMTNVGTTSPLRRSQGIVKAGDALLRQKPS